jgi:hypothetical protein
MQCLECKRLKAQGLLFPRVRCMSCQAEHDKRNPVLQLSLLEDSINYLEEIVNHIVYKFTDEWGHIYDKRDL